MLGKLKQINWKEFFFTHSEKIGFGAAIFFVLIALSMTNWSTYAKSPDDFDSEAKKISDLLMRSTWPESERSKFVAVDFTSEVKNRIDAPLKSQPFEYIVEMSPKLYPKEAQLKDVELPKVEDVIALGGRTVIETQPPGATQSSFPDAAPEVAKKATPKAPVDTDEFATKGGGDSNPGVPMAGALPGAPIAGALPAAGADVETADGPKLPSRGMRYNAVLAIVPHKKIIDAIKAALNVPYGDAADKLKYYDTKIERQKALPGGVWPDAWEELSLEPVIAKIRDEWNGSDAEVVDINVTDTGFTMPLPPRVMGTWKDHGTHPRLNAYLLSQEQAEKAAEEQAKLVEIANKQVKKEKGGFGGVQVDVGGLQRGLGAAGAAGAPGNMPGMRNAPAFGVGAPIAGAPIAGAPMAGMAGDAAQAKTVSNHSELLLFRYFDLDPEPGASYRYRVRVVITNPNLGADISRLEKPEVAQGETRETPWSDASNAVTVEADTDYFVTKIPRVRGRTQTGVMMDVYQWNASLGTIEKGQFTLNYGQNVGGRVKTTEGDFLNESATANKEVLLYGQDLLVDAQGAPGVVPADHPDLTALKAAGGKLQDGLLDEALTVMPDGDLKVTSRHQAEAEKPKVDARYSAQMARINEFLEKSKAEEDKKGSLEEADPNGGKKKSGKTKRLKNPAVGATAVAPIAGAPAPAAAGKKKR